MVSIVAFQAVDRGSITRWRSYFWQSSNNNEIVKGKNFVRSGIRTHAHISGPEFSQMLMDLMGYNLESGALDHSAILTLPKEWIETIDKLKR